MPVDTGVVVAAEISLIALALWLGLRRIKRGLRHD